MENYKIEFLIDNKIIRIEAPLIYPNRIKLESYIPLPTINKNQRMTAAAEIANFESDIKGLMPKTLQGSPFDNSMYSLFQVIDNHVKIYNRLMPSDLFTYINEAIILISAISDQILNQKLTQEDCEWYFVNIFKVVWSKFSEEMKLFYYECGKQEPVTYYIIRSFA